MISRYRLLLYAHRFDLGALALFAALTVLMTYPLATQMGGSVVGWVGDNFYFVWLIGWFQHALIDLRSSPLAVPSLNYPEGWNLAYNEITPAMVLIGLPASMIGGPTLGYNVSIFVSFILSGFGVYLWVRNITDNGYAAILAGVIFAFAPYRMSHLLGHFNLLGTQWFPFYFMSLHSLLEQPAWSWRRLFAASIFWLLICLTSQYYLYMTLILTVSYCIGYLCIVDHTCLFDASFWKRFVSLAAIALVLALVAIAPYLQLVQAGALPQRSFEEVRMWSASPTDFLLPSPRHFIWGPWVERTFDRSLWIENTLYLGAVALVLAAIALIMRKQLAAGARTTLLFVWMACATLVLALGTDLHWFGTSVIVDVPAFLQRLHPYQQTFIPLPGYFLFKYLPFYANMRVWMRYGTFVSLFISMLAGLGSAYLLQTLNVRLRTLAAAALLLLILTDLYAGSQLTSPVRARAVDTWLAAQPGEGAVVQIPFTQVLQPEQTYYTLVHHKPFVGGFFAAYLTPQFRHLEQPLRLFPNTKSIARLREVHVRWVVVDAAQYKDFPHTHEQIQAAGLRFAVALDGQYVYELK